MFEWISLEKISTSQKTISEQQVKDVFFLLHVSPKCQIVTNNEYAALSFCVVFIEFGLFRLLIIFLVHIFVVSRISLSLPPSVWSVC